jgi:hypothetical protein
MVLPILALLFYLALEGLRPGRGVTLRAPWWALDEVYRDTGARTVTSLPDLGTPDKQYYRVVNGEKRYQKCACRVNIIAL